MTIKNTKNTNSTQLDVDRLIRPLLDQLGSAVRRGQWFGIDGVKKCLDNPRIAMSGAIGRKNGTTKVCIKTQNKVLIACLEYMVQIAEESKEWATIRNFINYNPSTIMHAAKTKPDLFISHPNLFKYCTLALSVAHKKKLSEIIYSSNVSEQQGEQYSSEEPLEVMV